MAGRSVKRAGQFQPGQSGNPLGRPKLSPEMRELQQSNGEKATLIMAEVLNDPDAFGKNGWIPIREQLKWVEVAQTRAYGKGDVIEHHGQVEHVPRLQAAPTLEALPEAGKG